MGIQAGKRLAQAGIARKRQWRDSNWGLQTPKLILVSLNHAASGVKLPSLTMVATQLYYLFIIINKYLSRAHRLRGIALVSTATHCQRVMGVSCAEKNNAVIPCDRGSDRWQLHYYSGCLSAGSAEPAGAGQGVSKKKLSGGERLAVTWDDGLLSLWRCLQSLLKQNPSQVYTIIVLFLGDKSNHPGQKVKFDCTADSSTEVSGNDYRAK